MTQREIQVMSFAVEAHQKTNHLYDGKPYLIHLAMVVYYAHKYKDIVCISTEGMFEDVLCACWLHDTIEDCRLTYNDIKAIAGERVADMVYALTNDKGKTRKERTGDNYYKGILEVAFARYVKLCDRLANSAYGKAYGGGMLNTYRAENREFIEALIPSSQDRERIYKPMIDELNELLK